MALSARQRAQQELLKAEAARIAAETPANTEDVINARYTGYSGGYQFVTANGGTVTAANTSNAAPLIGESYQLKRDRSSGAFEFAPPARVQVQAERSRYNPKPWRVETSAPTTDDTAANGAGWLHLPVSNNPDFYVRRNDSGGWAKLYPSVIPLYGDPNGLEYPWVANAVIYDLRFRRIFFSNPWGNPDGENVDLKWIPMNIITFDSLGSGESIYTGDLYQDQTDGALYRLNSSGNWVMQFYCPECETEPTPPEDPESVSGYIQYDSDTGFYWWPTLSGVAGAGPGTTPPRLPDGADVDWIIDGVYV